MKQYLLNLSPDYCRDWTDTDAIREILQNCLDDKSSFEYFFDGGEAHFTSVNTTLPASTLLLGNTTKHLDGDSVGGFGEGYKICLLVLLRSGCEVLISNGTKLWAPAFEYQEQYDSKMLVMNESHPSHLEGHTNLTFSIKGLEEGVIEETIERCLYIQDDIGEVLEGSTGRILLDTPGKLFVGGLFVTEIAMNYSYDFNPDVLKLNRDRKNVDSWDLSYELGKLWVNVKSSEEIAQMMYDKVPDVNKCVISTGSTALKEACYDVYEREHGLVPMATSFWQEEAMIEDGYKDVLHLGNDVFSEAVKDTDSYKSLSFDIEEKEEEKSPLEMLYETVEQLHFMSDTNCRKMQELYDMFDARGVVWDD